MDIAAPVKQYNKLREQINPNIEELETFIKATENNNDSQNIKALRLKYQTMTTVPTTIEKTMSPYQLYASNSPLWAIELDALSIESFLDIEKNKANCQKQCSIEYTNIKHKANIAST